MYEQFDHAQISQKDITIIFNCRGRHNRLGYAYQLTFVRLLGRFPVQQPLELENDILTFSSVQLGIDTKYIQQYGVRQQTVSEHQESIRAYLSLRSFHLATTEVSNFLFQQACQLEQPTSLKIRLKEFLLKQHILQPSEDTLNRLIQTQRDAARNSIYSKLEKMLTKEDKERLDYLVDTGVEKYSTLHSLKQPPGNPSPASFLKLTHKLNEIRKTGVLSIDLSWINNNFQRSLARYARQCSIYRLRRLKNSRKYAVLASFLVQLYQETFDSIVQMHDKLINKVYNKADKEIDSFMKARRRHIRSSLTRYKKILSVLLDDTIEKKDSAIFEVIDFELLKIEMETVDEMLGNDYSNNFKRIISRYSYLRQFAPALIKNIRFQASTQDNIGVLCRTPPQFPVML